MTGLEDFKRYRIGQAAKLLGVKTSVLRFWEGEFAELDPVRTESGQRLYTKEHIVLLRRIRGLLYDEGLTIEGAKKRLADNDVPNVTSVVDNELIRDIADELRSILIDLRRSSFDRTE